VAYRAASLSAASNQAANTLEPLGFLNAVRSGLAYGSIRLTRVARLTGITGLVRLVGLNGLIRLLGLTGIVGLVGLHLG
jgi:hypothetical protein